MPAISPGPADGPKAGAAEPACRRPVPGGMSRADGRSSETGRAMLQVPFPGSSCRPVAWLRPARPCQRRFCGHLFILGACFDINKTCPSHHDAIRQRSLPHRNMRISRDLAIMRESGMESGAPDSGRQSAAARCGDRTAGKPRARREGPAKRVARGFEPCGFR